ncbi:MAG TPA: hypothetical protein VH912_27975 [Streptosporangiaceae bacterium]
MNNKVAIQPAGTLHGTLQRGLGRAARRAADIRGAGELVYDCIRHDPRWDRQCESRGLYYARLVVDLELPVGPIADHLFDVSDLVDTDEWRTSLAIDVLADLVRLSRRDAAGALRRYAEDGWNWFEALDALLQIGDESLTTGLDEVAVERCDDDDLYWLATDAGNPVVRAWAARHARVAEAVARRHTSERPRRREPGPSERADAELVELARGGDDVAVEAILELGRRRSPVLLDLAEEFLPQRPSRWGSVVCKALRDYGSAALPRARAWAASGAAISDVGIDIVARHGTQQDIPLLLDDLDRAYTQGNWGAAANPAEGLGRLRAGAAVPLLQRTWDESAYAYLRPRLLTALTRTAPHTGESFATEGLWDCEEDVRRIAVGAAPLDDVTTVRLRRLRRDAAEDPRVVAAATTRLGA